MNITRRQTLAGLIAAATFALSLNCSDAPTMAGGSGSSTTNGITASIRNPNGTPARGALVRLRPSDFLSGMAIDTSLTSLIDTVTDSTGTFTISDLKAGDYAIEIAGTSNLGLLLKQEIRADDTLHHLGDTSLELDGSVQGQIDKTNIDDSVHLAVRFYGLDRVVTCGSDGRFSVDAVPASMYTLRVTGSAPEVGNLDVPLVSVRSGQPTQLSAVSMPIDYLRDSVAVRAYLDRANLTNVEWDSAIIVKGGRIRALDLTGLGLATLDSTIVQLDFLWDLHLGGNHFAVLPASLKRMPLLTAVYLNGGPLDSLPSVITELTFINALDLDGTGLRTLPAAMANMTTLRNMSMERCGLDSIPSAVFTIPNLSTFHVGYNNLTSLPAQIGDLRNLEKIWVNDNQITSLPDEIGNLTKLKEFWAYRNMITQLPATIGLLRDSLRILQLETSQLTVVPAEIGNLTNLVELHLQSNQLTTLPFELASLTLLTTLNLYGNRMCTLPVAVEQWVVGVLGADWRTKQPQVGCP